MPTARTGRWHTPAVGELDILSQSAPKAVSHHPIAEMASWRRSWSASQ
jgi:hypothetical protein